MSAPVECLQQSEVLYTRVLYTPWRALYYNMNVVTNKYTDAINTVTVNNANDARTVSIRNFILKRFKPVRDVIVILLHFR